MTGTALRLLVRDYLGIPTGYVRCTDANIDDYAAEAMHELAEAALPDSLRRLNVAIPTVIGTSVYSLAPFTEIPVRVLSVAFNGLLLKRVDSSDLYAIDEAWESLGNGTPTHYTIDNYTAAGYPIIRIWPPPAAATSLIIRYVGPPLALSASQLIEWPVAVQYAIARYAAWRCAVKLSESMWTDAKCQLWLQKWQSDKADFIKRCSEHSPLQNLNASVQLSERAAHP